MFITPTYKIFQPIPAHYKSLQTIFFNNKVNIHQNMVYFSKLFEKSVVKTLKWHLIASDLVLLNNIGMVIKNYF